ncbi:hypothetical protein CM15mP35_07290 [bacterium]|nr:MAG: hypothetical protein CM15mP35_07290 [bacterium]
MSGPTSVSTLLILKEATFLNLKNYLMEFGFRAFSESGDGTFLKLQAIVVFSRNNLFQQVSSHTGG